MPSDRMIRLLAKHERHAWPMPTTIRNGLLLAMLGHGLWNGTSWGIGMLLSNGEPWLAGLLQIAWLLVMVATLWFAFFDGFPPSFFQPKNAPIKN